LSQGFEPKHGTLVSCGYKPLPCIMDFMLPHFKV
jgi:hypothetical protein